MLIFKGAIGVGINPIKSDNFAVTVDNHLIDSRLIGVA